MQDLIIEKKRNSFEHPRIHFHADTGICDILGESYPENSKILYHPVMDWLKKYCFELRRPLILNLKLYYFNTSSSKELFDILFLLKEYKEDGGDVDVNWFHDKEDQMLIDEVGLYKEITGLEITLKEYTEKEIEELRKFKQRDAGNKFIYPWI